MAVALPVPLGPPPGFVPLGQHPSHAHHNPDLGVMDKLAAGVNVVFKPKNLIDIIKLVVEATHKHTGYAKNVSHFRSHLSVLAGSRLLYDAKSIGPDFITALKNTGNLRQDPRKAIASYCDLACDALKGIGYYGKYLNVEKFSDKFLRLGILTDIVLATISSSINFFIERGNEAAADRKIRNPGIRVGSETLHKLTAQKHTATIKKIHNVIFVALGLTAFIIVSYNAVLFGWAATALMVGTYSAKVLYGDYLKELREMKEKKIADAQYQAYATHLVPGHLGPDGLPLVPPPGPPHGGHPPHGPNGTDGHDGGKKSPGEVNGFVKVEEQTPQ